jgi:hypothetical protein
MKRSPNPLEIFREGLALFRRAGLSWFEAEPPAYEATMRVAPAEEAEEYSNAIYSCRTAWMRAFERRPTTGCSL